MKIKSFRGKIADNGIDTISLSTNNGSIGYRIKKLQIIPEDPGANNGEHTIKIFTIPQTAAASTVDFSDNTLLGVASLSTHSGNALFTEIIVFDNMTFNQDIYVTHTDRVAAASCNYYIELEQMSLALDENTVATLKDIRNITEPAL